MHAEKKVEREEVVRTYDYHILKGSIIEEETPDTKRIVNLISEADILLEGSKTLKGEQKILNKIKEFIFLSFAFAERKNCKIEDVEAAFCFLCVRHPDLEMDFEKLQKFMLIYNKNQENNNSNNDNIMVAISNTEKFISDRYSDNKLLELALNIYISELRNRLKIDKIV